MGDKSGSRKPGSPTDASGAAPPEVSKVNRQAFDAWLDRQLRDLYETAAAEPIPDDILALLNKRTPDAS